jgi:hypothetical protein
MQETGLLDALPIWVVFLVTLLLVLLSIEGGFRFARYKQKRAAQEAEAQAGAIVGATLGLLAFLLAFTFGIAAERFDRRKQTLVDETNAIGTAYLRAGLLPEPHRTAVRNLLREYVDERLHWAGVEKAKEVRSAQELHNRLWAEAVAVGENDPKSIVVGLFITSVNEVIDLHATRLVVRQRSRIPRVFWVVLYGIAILGMAGIGYHSGITETRRSPMALATAIAFSAVFMLVVDLDRPGEGWIDVSQQIMIDLRDSIAESRP